MIFKNFPKYFIIYIFFILLIYLVGSGESFGFGGSFGFRSSFDLGACSGACSCAYSRSGVGFLWSVRTTYSAEIFILGSYKK